MNNDNFERLTPCDRMIQIVAKDNINNILIVVTWDCYFDKEYSMF